MDMTVIQAAPDGLTIKLTASEATKLYFDLVTLLHNCTERKMLCEFISKFPIAAFDAGYNSLLRREGS